MLSEDIFVPGATGFFSVVGNDPETVIANFAVGKGLPNRDDISQKAESKALASTRVKNRLELCSINPTPSVSSLGCSFRRAYIAIESHDPHHGGSIDFQYASKFDNGNDVLFYNFPNAPDSVIGTWFKNMVLCGLKILIPSKQSVVANYVTGTIPADWQIVCSGHFRLDLESCLSLKMGNFVIFPL